MRKRACPLPIRRSLAEMEQRYGVDLDANSHGQSFLKLFASRFVPGGLYLLDEPEAPLSPQSQLALIAMIAGHDRAGRAVHHRDALADPAGVSERADLQLRSRADRVECRFEELDHVVLTRDFLDDPEKFLRHLAH